MTRPDKEKAPEQPTMTIPVSVVQAVVDYLQERPYRETASLIHSLLAHNPKQ